MSTKTRRTGRPLGERTDYAADLAHLARLRHAAARDRRLSSDEYMKIADAVRDIETILRATAQKRG